MPYPGVPKSRVAKLDRCVKKVIARKQFVEIYRNRKNKSMSKKSLAIGICRATMKI